MDVLRPLYFYRKSRTLPRGYLGAEIRGGTLYFAPRQTDKLEGLSLPMRFHETPIDVTLGEGELTVAAQADGFGRTVEVGVGDEVQELTGGQSHTFEL